MKNNDNDIKIASSHPARDQHARPAPEEERPAAGINLTRAREFGREMAKKMLRAEKILAPDAADAVNALQYKILFAFSVAAGLELYSGSTGVFRAALNGFYDRLRELDRQLYTDLDSTGAFSFYYLEFRRGGNAAAGIGGAFAMLCGKEGDFAAAEQGTALYTRFLSFIKGELDSAGLLG